MDLLIFVGFFFALLWAGKQGIKLLKDWLNR